MFEMTDIDNVRLNGARIKVVGVGGGGCNAVNTMIRSGLSGVEYVVANTDAQALSVSLAPTKVQLGGSITKGLGAGANPEVGKKSALEDYEKISEILKGADMVFITAGMGGGTGTGAAPVIAKLAKDLGALTVGVVTKPFVFEGKKRFRQAEEGIRNLEESVDSLITIPNQRLLFLAGENLSLVDTFKRADEVLLNAVRGISDLINNTGHINADFADVSTVMANKGLALMGTGSATGSGRAIKAATEAISSPLLEDISINGATGIIINITGSESLSMHETNEAVTLIMEAADENAEIIFGTVIDNNCGDEVKVTVIATGLGINAHNHILGTKTTSIQSTANVINNIHTSTVTEQVIATPVATSNVISSQVETIATPTYVAPVATQQNVQTNYEAVREPVREPVREVSPTTQNYSQQQPQTNNVQSANNYEADMYANRRGNTEPDRSDFDRFMNDRNSFVNQDAQPEVSHGNNSQQQAPSRLIQSIRDAANRYENNSGSKPAQGNVTNPGNSYTARSETHDSSMNNRAKSIAEKLGFVNFDEDEFDTPSYLRKDEKENTKPAPREFKNLEL